jgi:hypothetical protein
VAVQNQTIKAYLNDTQIETGLTTDENGCFTFERNFNPSDKKVTYTVQVSFEGTGSTTAMLNATALDGTRYTVCQTTQFSHKPSANMTTIVVEPQATQVTVPTETAEEMQQEAQDNGELRTYTWSGIWFPWFRMHFVAALNGQDLLDVGLSVLWSDVVIVYPRLQSWIADAINTVIISPIAKALLIGWITTEVAVYMAMQFGPGVFALALITSIALKFTMLGLSWDDRSGLKGAFVGALFSWAYGLTTSLKSLVDLGISCLNDFLKLDAANLWKLVYKFIYIPVNLAFLIAIIVHSVEIGGWTW